MSTSEEETVEVDIALLAGHMGRTEGLDSPMPRVLPEEKPTQRFVPRRAESGKRSGVSLVDGGGYPLKPRPKTAKRTLWSQLRQLTVVRSPLARSALFGLVLAVALYVFMAWSEKRAGGPSVELVGAPLPTSELTSDDENVSSMTKRAAVERSPEPTKIDPIQEDVGTSSERSHEGLNDEGVRLLARQALVAQVQGRCQAARLAYEKLTLARETSRRLSASDRSLFEALHRASRKACASDDVTGTEL
jgi:hypothetical protein